MGAEVEERILLMLAFIRRSLYLLSFFIAPCLDHIRLLFVALELLSAAWIINQLVDILVDIFDLLPFMFLRPWGALSWFDSVLLLQLLKLKFIPVQDLLQHGGLLEQSHLEVKGEVELGAEICENNQLLLLDIPCDIVDWLLPQVEKIHSRCLIA